MQEPETTAIKQYPPLRSGIANNYDGISNYYNRLETIKGKDILAELNNIKYLIQDDTLKKEEILTILEYRARLLEKLKKF